jgi:hypothetical protein
MRKLKTAAPQVCETAVLDGVSECSLLFKTTERPFQSLKQICHIGQL